jgi:hypothetical protein
MQDLVGSRVRFRKRGKPDFFGRILEVSCSVTLESSASSFKASSFKVLLDDGSSLETTGVNLVIENEVIASQTGDGASPLHGTRQKLIPNLPRLWFPFLKGARSHAGHVAPGGPQLPGV